MSWCGVILAVEHFVKEKAITVGVTQKSDFAIPSMLSSSQHPIVTQSGGNFVLNLDDQMKGVMQKTGELKSLEDIRESTMKGTHGHEVPIGNNYFAKVSIGDIDFYFSFTAAPPRLKMRRIFERDPFFQRIFFISMVLTVVMLFSLSKLKLPTAIDAEQCRSGLRRFFTSLRSSSSRLQSRRLNLRRSRLRRRSRKKPQKETPKPKVPEPPKPKPTPKETVKVTITPKPQETHKPPPKEMGVAKPE